MLTTTSTTPAAGDLVLGHLDGAAMELLGHDATTLSAVDHSGVVESLVDCSHHARGWLDQGTLE